MLDVTRQTVSRWESGKSYPSIPQMARICSTFAIDANEMLGCTTEKSDDAQTKENGAEDAQQKPHAKRKFIACVAVLAALFAAALGVSVSCYAGYEQGYREPDLKMLIKICDLLGLSADYILFGTNRDNDTMMLEKIHRIDDKYIPLLNRLITELLALSD